MQYRCHQLGFQLSTPLVQSKMDFQELTVKTPANDSDKKERDLPLNFETRYKKRSFLCSYIQCCDGCWTLRCWQGPRMVLQLRGDKYMHGLLQISHCRISEFSQRQLSSLILHLSTISVRTFLA